MTTSRVATSLPQRDGTAYGQSLAIALSSAATFGLSGPLARALLDVGWTPAAAVSARIGGACLVLLIPCIVLLRRTGLPHRRQVAHLIAYGLIAVGGAQLCYFNAVQYLSVGVALLLEYSAPVLLIGYHWLRSRHRPALPVLLGAAVSIVGLILVLDLRHGFDINPIGVAWGLGAAVCLCGYFILSETGDPDTAVHPLLLTTMGTGVGAAAVLAGAGLGVLPLHARPAEVSLGGASMSWIVPMLGLIGITAVFAYLTGIVAVRRLGSSVASFVALTEVLFAVLFAFLLLGQQPGPIQLMGGALVLAGIVVVQRRNAEKAPRPDMIDAADHGTDVS